jgi:hypothetical protein
MLIGTREVERWYGRIQALGNLSSLIWPPGTHVVHGASVKVMGIYHEEPWSPDAEKMTGNTKYRPGSGKHLRYVWNPRLCLMTISNFTQANEVYAQKEKPIPVVPCSDAFISDMRHYELQKQLQYKQSVSETNNSSYRFSRDDLKEAIVVNQVDSKFIACLLPSGSVTGDAGYGSGPTSQGPSRTLVLVDQHAADERVRVEWLQRDVSLAYLRNDDGTGVKRIVLDPPIAILLTRREKLVLLRSSDFRDFLASWGVEFAPIKDTGEEHSPSDDDGNYSQITVTSIPEIVDNRVCDQFVLTHPCVNGLASSLRGMTCRILSRVCSGIGQMMCTKDHLSHLSRHTVKTCSRGSELYEIAPPNSWSCSTPRLAEVRPYNFFIR